PCPTTGPTTASSPRSARCGESWWPRYGPTTTTCLATSTAPATSRRTSTGSPRAPASTATSSRQCGRAWPPTWAPASGLSGGGRRGGTGRWWIDGRGRRSRGPGRQRREWPSKTIEKPLHPAGSEDLPAALGEDQEGQAEDAPQGDRRQPGLDPEAPTGE